MAGSSQVQTGGGGSRRRRGAGATPWVFIGVSAWYLALLAGCGVMLRQSPEALDTRDLWIGVLAVVAGVAPVALVAGWRARPGATAGAEQRLGELARSIESMTREGGLSESAKRVLHRREERELLRRAIEQDILDEDWDAAMVLVRELAERFGYRADAEELRARIDRARARSTDQQAVESIDALNELIRQRQWVRAFEEAGRIQRLYPDSHRVEGLRERVASARTQYRKELERRFLEAAEQQEIDSAMKLLRELDHYLSPEEAGPFQEVARGVIVKSRQNLGSRFKLLVQDHEWSAAAGIGRQIIGEFPNSRIAQEVREMMPLLEERAQREAKSRA